MMLIKNSSVLLQTLIISFVLMFTSINTNAEVRILMKTSEGDMQLSLDDKKAPVTVANFVQYVESGFYSGSIFHRVISNFMIQGGGFDENMVKKPTQNPIANEGTNGLTNDFGTIAMARINNPNSATSQFFINHKNNAFLNASGRNPGYAVFGQVTKGLDVLEKIAASKTSAKGGHQNVPLKAIVIKEMLVLKGEDAAETQQEVKQEAKAVNKVENTAVKKPIKTSDTKVKP